MTDLPLRLLGICMPSALTRRLTVAAAALPMTAGALLAGAVPALAGTPTGTPTGGAAPAALAPVSHPDADHMGSTIRAHQPPAAVQPPAVAPRMLSLTAAQPAGMDVSSLQGTVDWATAAANGATFAYIKATEATGYVNPYLASQYTGAYAAGIIRGTYHFALPDRSTGAAQANYFLSHLGGWSPDGKTLPPMLDMEYNPYGATCYGQTPGAAGRLDRRVLQHGQRRHRPLPDHLHHHRLVDLLPGQQRQLRRDQPAVHRQLRRHPRHHAAGLGLPEHLAVQRPRHPARRRRRVQRQPRPATPVRRHTPSHTGPGTGAAGPGRCSRPDRRPL